MLMRIKSKYYENKVEYYENIRNITRIKSKFSDKAKDYENLNRRN